MPILNRTIIIDNRTNVSLNQVTTRTGSMFIATGDVSSACNGCVYLHDEGFTTLPD